MNTEHDIDNEIDGQCVANEWFERLDRFLAHSDVKISDRPLDVAFLLVKNEIVVPDCGMTENFVAERWFTDLLKYVRIWYDDKYGNFKKEKSTIKGVILIYGTPYLVNVPVTVTKASKNQEKHLEVYCPRSVLDGERILDMIVSPPNFNSMDQQLRNSILKRVKSIVVMLRNINIDLSLAAVSEQYYAMRQSVVQHLNNAVEQFVKNQIGPSCFMHWDIHLAIEKTLKIYLLQRDHAFPKTHDLRKLFKIAGGSKELGFDEKLFRAIPSDKQIVNFRYYGSYASNLDFMLTYKAVVAIIKRISRKITHTFGVTDSTCFIVQDLRC
ncbi:MAG: HEPN domain-containing protein [Desulfovibrionaceae bacterium]|nr:HEPN domain-containing protein [Desulfovibrionaceae bacterium]